MTISWLADKIEQWPTAKLVPVDVHLKVTH